MKERKMSLVMVCGVERTRRSSRARKIKFGFLYGRKKNKGDNEKEGEALACKFS